MSEYKATNVVNNQIQLSDADPKDSAAFPNDLVLNASGGFNIPESKDIDDSASLSEGSVVSNCDSYVSAVNRDASTLDTNTIDTNYIHNLSKESLDENTDMNSTSVISKDSDDEKFIDDLLDIDSTKEENGGAGNHFTGNDTHYNDNSYSNYDKESKEVRGRPSACVFVASLSSNMSDDVLCQSVTNHFKQWGEMTLVKVLRDPANRPYAFVQYAKDEDADKAISEGQHSILNGRTVRCEKARVNRTLYLQIASAGICEKTMKKLLSRFGEIERLVAVNENFNVANSAKTPNKNWFCKYVYRQDAISAFANLKTKANWNIEWAQNLEDEYKNVPEVTIDRYSVFVGHLDPRISKEEMLERFEKHGKIKEAILVNRPLSNFAFIKFKTKEAAASAVECENHSMFKFKTIHVQYRELYNNYRRKFSNDNGLKLNLAPPPVNFKRRNFFHSNRQMNRHNQPNHHYYRTKNNSYFEDFDNGNKNENDEEDDGHMNIIPNEQVPETFAQAMKLKHSYPSRGRFNFNYGGNKFIKSQHVTPLKKFSINANEHPHAHFDTAYFPQSKDVEIDDSKSLIDDGEDNKDEPRNASISDAKNNSFANEFEDAEKENLANKDNKEVTDIASTSAHEHNLDNDMSTMRSNNTYSSAGVRTGYSYSSVDNGELESANINMASMANHSQYQYPYYYYYPTKKMPYMNSQMHPMIPNDPNINGPNPPPSSNPAYYYTYAGYPPGTPNGQMPAMYPPVYLYYNSVPMMEHSNEAMDQPIYRNNENVNNMQES